MRKSFLLALGFTLISSSVILSPLDLSGVPAFAAAPTTDAGDSDASWYSQHYGVPLDEAVREMVLGDEAGLLDAVLTKEEEASFGGIWIEHDPFSIQVRMLPGSEDLVWKHVTDPDLAGVLKVAPRNLTLAELLQEEAVVQDLLVSNEVYHLLGIDVRQGELTLTVRPEASATLQQLDLARFHLELTELDFKIVPATIIYGGLALSNGCTSGFTVAEDSPGTRTGISTAAHCGDVITYAGTNLPLQAQRLSGSTDAQWHTTPGITDLGEFESGQGVRVVNNVQSRADQAVGDLICKFGRTTGRTCMDLHDKSIDATGCFSQLTSFTWMLGCNTVSSGACDIGTGGLGGPGDSGGPVYKNNNAKGTLSCLVYVGQDVVAIIYMAPNFFHDIDVHVLH